MLVKQFLLTVLRCRVWWGWPASSCAGHTHHCQHLHTHKSWSTSTEAVNPVAMTTYLLFGTVFLLSVNEHLDVGQFGQQEQSTYHLFLGRGQLDGKVRPVPTWVSGQRAGSPAQSQRLGHEEQCPGSCAQGTLAGRQGAVWRSDVGENCAADSSYCS